MDKLKDSAADGKTKSRTQMGRLGSGPEFHVNCGSGRVGLSHFTCGSGWVGSSKLDSHPTLRQTASHNFYSKMCQSVEYKEPIYANNMSHLRKVERIYLQHKFRQVV